MEAKLEKIPVTLSSSITVKREVTPFMDYPWHYHPEYEIILVEKSYGIRFMGNHIGNFTDGDLMFIGSNLPHLWRNDKDFYQGNKELSVDVYVIHFKENALKDGFFDLPELTHIKNLFIKGQQGVLFLPGNEHEKIAALIKKTVAATGFKRLILFLKTLETMATSRNYNLLSSPGYIGSINYTDTERINKIMEYVMEHYPEDIDLGRVASLAHLTKISFCRYFKTKTHKTFTQFLNEVRILNACKLLMKNDMTITEICYSCGYNNISHFNRQFKIITGLSAKHYAKRFLQIP